MSRIWLPFMMLVGVLAAPVTTAFAQASEKPVRQQDEKKKDQKPKLLKVGSTVPESLTLSSFQAEQTAFKEFRGKVTIVHFWSDRCPAERHGNPVFLELEKRYAGNKDVMMVGIAANQNELGSKPGKDADLSKHYVSLRKKIKQVGFTHKIFTDHGNKISTLFQARSTPHCFVIDKKGVIQYAGALDDDPRGRKGKQATNYLVDATTAILGGKRPEITTTRPYG